MMDLKDTPHRRFNALTREWVLVSPHRTQRPWSGQVEAVRVETPPSYDPDCYLCPGNSRAAGARNPQYTSTFVFDNDYPALLADVPAGEVDESGLIVARPERGLCRVVCFSPRHDLSIPSMSPQELRQVVDVWADQYNQLGDLDWVAHVQIFENHGALMGASNPHPHCQIWANATLPNHSARERESLQEYAKSRGACLLCDYLHLEQQAAERLVCANEAFTALVPFWAVWPFEVLVIANRHLGAMDELTASERDLLGNILKQVTARYDMLFSVPFPYSMGFHQRPTDRVPHPEWHLHAHYYPPLLRSASVQKFMVGYEMLGTPQRDITPEVAAGKLRDLVPEL